MFSLSFLRSTISLLLKHPSVAGAILLQRNVSQGFEKSRERQWQKVRTKYRHTPKLTNGQWMFLNPSDSSAVSSSIATSGYLNLAVTSLLKKVVKQGMTIVDVGANIGYYTLILSKLTGKTGIVLSYEPEPVNFAFMINSIRTNGCSNIQAYCMALSSQEGFTTLYLSPTNPALHSTIADRSKGRLRVPCTTLDAVWRERHIDLIKLHASGAEAPILRGAGNMLRRNPPKILTSYTSREWRGADDILEEMFRRFEVFEVVRTPFLIKKISKTEIIRKGAAELYFLPL